VELLHASCFTEAERKGSLGKLKTICADNIKTVFEQMVYDDVDWVHLVQDWTSLAGSCEHSRESSG
jgi:hypothetical protein